MNKSALGSNRHVHHCDVLRNDQLYCMCLNVIAAVERGQKLSLSDCTHAIAQKTCPALVMRQQEEEAGTPLFFVEREQVPVAIARSQKVEANERIDLNSPSYLRGRYGDEWERHYKGAYRSTNSVKKKTPESPKQAEGFKPLEYDMTKVVEKVMRDELKPVPGESPLAYARRRREMLGA